MKYKPKNTIYIVNKEKTPNTSGVEYYYRPNDKKKYIKFSGANDVMGIPHHNQTLPERAQELAEASNGVLAMVSFLDTCFTS